MSLKQKILYYLEKNGSMSLLELENLCKSAQYKLSNGERRLRELTSPLHRDFNPCVGAEKNAKGTIIAYYWHEAPAYQTPLTEGARRFLEQWKLKEVKKELTLF